MSRIQLTEELAAICDDTDLTIPSLAVAIIRDSKLLCHHQLGRKRIDSTDPSRDRPVDGQTLFRIASIST